MAKGLAIPMRVDANGSSVVSEADEEADKIIALALSDGENDNAFQQDITLGTSAVFEVANPGFRARTLARLFRLFADFEKLRLFSIDKTSIKWTKDAGGQTLTFSYINLESDQKRTFARKFTGRGG